MRQQRSLNRLPSSGALRAADRSRATEAILAQPPTANLSWFDADDVFVSPIAGSEPLRVRLRGSMYPTLPPVSTTPPSLKPRDAWQSPTKRSPGKVMSPLTSPAHPGARNAAAGDGEVVLVDISTPTAVARARRGEGIGSPKGHFLIADSPYLLPAGAPALPPRKKFLVGLVEPPPPPRPLEPSTIAVYKEGVVVPLSEPSTAESKAMPLARTRVIWAELEAQAQEARKKEASLRRKRRRAAIRIQCMCRCWLARRELARARERAEAKRAAAAAAAERAAIALIQEAERILAERERVRLQAERQHQRRAAALTLQCFARRCAARHRVAAIRAEKRVAAERRVQLQAAMAARLQAEAEAEAAAAAAREAAIREAAEAAAREAAREAAERKKAELEREGAIKLQCLWRRKEAEARVALMRADRAAKEAAAALAAMQNAEAAELERQTRERVESESALRLQCFWRQREAEAKLALARAERAAFEAAEALAAAQARDEAAVAAQAVAAAEARARAEGEAAARARMEQEGAVKLQSLWRKKEAEATVALIRADKAAKEAAAALAATREAEAAELERQAQEHVESESAVRLQCFWRKREAEAKVALARAERAAVAAAESLAIVAAEEAREQAAAAEARALREAAEREAAEREGAVKLQSLWRKRDAEARVAVLRADKAVKDAAASLAATQAEEVAALERQSREHVENESAVKLQNFWRQREAEAKAALARAEEAALEAAQSLAVVAAEETLVETVVVEGSPPAPAPAPPASASAEDAALAVAEAEARAAQEAAEREVAERDGAVRLQSFWRRREAEAKVALLRADKAAKDAAAALAATKAQEAAELERQAQDHVENESAVRLQCFWRKREAEAKVALARAERAAVAAAQSLAATKVEGERAVAEVEAVEAAVLAAAAAADAAGPHAVTPRRLVQATRESVEEVASSLIAAAAVEVERILTPPPPATEGDQGDAENESAVRLQCFWRKREAEVKVALARAERAAKEAADALAVSMAAAAEGGPVNTAGITEDQLESESVMKLQRFWRRKEGEAKVKATSPPPPVDAEAIPAEVDTTGVSREELAGDSVSQVQDHWQEKEAAAQAALAAAEKELLAAEALELEAAEALELEAAGPESEFSEGAAERAVSIQAMWRGHIARRAVQRIKAKGAMPLENIRFKYGTLCSGVRVLQSVPLFCTLHLEAPDTDAPPLFRIRVYDTSREKSRSKLLSLANVQSEMNLFFDHSAASLLASEPNLIAAHIRRFQKDSVECAEAIGLLLTKEPGAPPITLVRRPIKVTKLKTGEEVGVPSVAESSQEHLVLEEACLAARNPMLQDAGLSLKKTSTLPGVLRGESVVTVVLVEPPEHLELLPRVEPAPGGVTTALGAVVSNVEAECALRVGDSIISAADVHYYPAGKTPYATTAIMNHLLKVLEGASVASPVMLTVTRWQSTPVFLRPSMEGALPAMSITTVSAAVHPTNTSRIIVDMSLAAPLGIKLDLATGVVMETLPGTVGARCVSVGDVLVHLDGKAPKTIDRASLKAVLEDMNAGKVGEKNYNLSFRCKKRAAEALIPRRVFLFFTTGSFGFVLACESTQGVSRHFLRSVTQDVWGPHPPVAAGDELLSINTMPLYNIAANQVPSLLDMKALRNLFEVVPRLR